MIYKISDEGNKEFKKFANFFKTPYKKFWIRFKNGQIDENNQYLDEVVKMYNKYVENKFKEDEEKYYYALINLQKNMCKIFDIK